MNNSVPIVTNNSNSGKGLFIFIIIILTICCLGLGGYIIYSKFFVTTEVKVEDTSKALEQVKIDGSNLLEVEDIIYTFEEAYNDSFSKYFGYIYNADKIEIENFDPQAALFACLHPYLRESNNVSYVANSTVKHKFRTMFGGQLEYNPNAVNAGDGYAITYDATTRYYSYKRAGVGGYFYPTYVTFNDSCSVSTDKIEVVKRVAYLEFNADHSAITIYTDNKKTKKVAVMYVSDGAFNPTEIEAKYKSSLAQYTYTFTSSKDSFIFNKIVRTNNIVLIFYIYLHFDLFIKIFINLYFYFIIIVIFIML